MSKAIDNYFQWSCTALMGNNPQLAEKYLRENLADIRFMARTMLIATEYVPAPIYRGVVLPDRIVNGLPPHKNFTYLSFSEDKAVADHFANPGPDGFGSLHHLGDHGYTIEYTPQFDEVLWHNKFLEVLPYLEAFATVGVDGTNLYRQKEVTILQPATRFTKLTYFKR